MVSLVVVTILEDLRTVETLEALRERYCARDGDWVRSVADRCGLGEEHRTDLRRIEDAAYGLRWLEIAHGLWLDVRRSLARQLPLKLLRELRRRVTHGKAWSPSAVFLGCRVVLGEARWGQRTERLNWLIWWPTYPRDPPAAQPNSES